uniref:Uncharacterized protein n=1 Tax=Polysiphonia sertularioides TaxID=945028 RepID=A0A1Z1M918_9FLOR|nr:hypothetical protein [Polysiphonia sertularioides]ARW62470.1 hypothetical protein [Polysiphonia sertularioides]
MKNSYIFLKHLSGNWIIQNSILSFGSRRQNKSRNSILIYKNVLEYYNIYTEVEKFDSTNKISRYRIIHLQKKDLYKFYLKYMIVPKKQRFVMCLKYIRKGFFEIIHINLFNKIKKKEYIYVVTSKIVVIITIIQDLENKYLGARVSSCIKLKNKNNIRK